MEDDKQAMLNRDPSNMGRFISRERAKNGHCAWVRDFLPRIPDTTVAVVLGKDRIQKLLEVPGCKGVRIYFSLTKSNLDGNIYQDVVLVPVDVNGTDIYNMKGDCTSPAPNEHQDEDDSDMILNTSTPCPSYCS
jgi:hypothetical protein